MSDGDDARRVFARHRALVIDGAGVCATCRVEWPCPVIRPVLAELLADDRFLFD